MHQRVLKIGHRYPPQAAVVLASLAPTTSSPCFHPHFSILASPPPPPHTHTPHLPQPHLYTLRGGKGLWKSFSDGLVSCLLRECHGNQLHGEAQLLSNCASYPSKWKTFIWYIVDFDLTSCLAVIANCSVLLNVLWKSRPEEWQLRKQKRYLLVCFKEKERQTERGFLVYPIFMCSCDMRRTVYDHVYLCSFWSIWVT